MSRTAKVFISFTLLAIAAFIGCLLLGTVDISPREVWGALTGSSGNGAIDYIVMQTRLPAACAAMLASMALAVAGLLMQTMFANPLAGPSILGISTGASMGVAIVMLAMGGTAATGMILSGAMLGAMAVMIVLLALSSVLRSASMLLIAGILIGYLSGSAISIMNFFAPGESVHSYVIWGLGSFAGVATSQLPAMFLTIAVLTGVSFLLVKPLNALLLGTGYAESVGVSLRFTRNILLLLSGALTAAATAWCGPIGFIGLVVPHIARLALHSSDHRRLLPATALIGAATGLVCQLLSVAAGSRGIVPINAITPIIGVPVIIYIILNRRKIFYFI